MEQVKHSALRKAMEEALSIFERLSLKAGDNNGENDNEMERTGMHKISNFLCQKMQPSTASSYTVHLSKDRIRYRYRPYSLPVCYQKRDTCKHGSVSDKLRGIILEGDVDELRMTLMEQPVKIRRNKSSSCSLEASRYTWDSVDEGVDGIVAELAEYFDQFVTVCLKMSPLAESMYA